MRHSFSRGSPRPRGYVHQSFASSFILIREKILQVEAQPVPSFLRRFSSQRDTFNSTICLFHSKLLHLYFNLISTYSKYIKGLNMFTVNIIKTRYQLSIDKEKLALTVPLDNIVINNQCETGIVQLVERLGMENNKISLVVLQTL